MKDKYLYRGKVISNFWLLLMGDFYNAKDGYVDGYIVKRQDGKIYIVLNTIGSKDPQYLNCIVNNLMCTAVEVDPTTVYKI